MACEWHDVGSVDNVDLLDFLSSKGLAKQAQKIVDVTEAESVEDLKLIDVRMVEDVIKGADLKVVSAQKLRNAILELRGEAVDVAAASTAVSPDQIATGGPTSGMPENVAAAATAAYNPPPRTVQECVAICIDRSGSMGSPFNEVTVNVVEKAVAQRTRMEAVKAMFYAFRDRTATLGQGLHEIGLIQFDDRVEQLLDLTADLSLFEAIIDDMEKRGQTAIYSSIIAATEMLGRTFSEESSTDLRILVLTDGQSNSGATAQEALTAANRIGAVVDAIIVGNRPDPDLRRIVTATGGECYQIEDLGEGFELLEAEGVVSLKARRGGAEKPAFKLRETVCLGTTEQRQMTRGTAVQRAPALDATLAATVVADLSVTVSADASKFFSQGGPQIKRILTELKKAHDNDGSVWMSSGAGIHIYPAPDRIDFWRVLIEGPPNSPFEGGVFALSVNIPQNYPFSPPSVKFETPIYHCNVTDAGRICLDVLEHKWTPSLTVPKVLETIRTLMAQPDTNDALRQWIAELTLAHINTNGADTRYYEKATESLKKHASRSVEDWKKEWGLA